MCIERIRVGWPAFKHPCPASRASHEARHTAHETRRRPCRATQHVPENFSTSATSLPAGRRRASALKCSDTSNWPISVSVCASVSAVRCSSAQPVKAHCRPLLRAVVVCQCLARGLTATFVSAHHPRKAGQQRGAPKERILRPAGPAAVGRAKTRRAGLKSAAVGRALPFALVSPCPVLFQSVVSPWLPLHPSARPAASAAAASRCPRCGYSSNVRICAVCCVSGAAPARSQRAGRPGLPCTPDAQRCCAPAALALTQTLQTCLIKPLWCTRRHDVRLGAPDRKPSGRSQNCGVVAAHSAEQHARPTQPQRAHQYRQQQGRS